MKKFSSPAVAAVGAVTAALAFVAIAIAATLGFTACAPEAPLSTRGIPADAIGVVHIDLKAFANTPFNAPAHKLLSTGTHFTSRESEEFERFKKETGINPQTDLHSVTIGILPPTKSAEETRHRDAGGIIAVFRGKYSAQKVLAFAQREVPGKTFSKPITMGKHTVYCSRKTAFSFVSDSVFVFGMLDRSQRENDTVENLVKAALDSLDGTAKSYTPPATLASFGKQVGTPALLGFCDLAALQLPAKDPDDDESFPIPNSVHFALGISDSLTKLRSVAKFANAEDAKTLKEKANLWVAKRQVTVAKAMKRAFKSDVSDSSDAEKAENKFAKSLTLEARELLGQAKLTITDGNNVELSIDHSTPDLLSLLHDANASAEASIKERNERRRRP